MSAKIIPIQAHIFDQLELEDQASGGRLSDRHHRQWHIAERYFTQRECELFGVRVNPSLLMLTIFEQTHNGGSYDRVAVQAMQTGKLPKHPGIFGHFQTYRFLFAAPTAADIAKQLVRAS